MSRNMNLPGPYEWRWSWQEDAACQGLDVNMFYYALDERGPSKRQRVDEAVRVCAGCPVRQECAAFALTIGEPYGVWGGMSEEARIMESFAASEPHVRPITGRGSRAARAGRRRHSTEAQTTGAAAAEAVTRHTRTDAVNRRIPMEPADRPR